MPRRPGAPRTHRVSAAAGRGGWRGGRPQPAPTGRSTVCCPPPRRAERARAGAAANPGAAPHLPPAPTLPAAAAPPAAPERGLPRSPAYLPMAGSRRPGGEGGEGQGLALPCLAGLDCAAPGWGGRRGSGQRRQLAHWRAPLRLRRLRRGERGGDGPACLRRPRGSRLDRPGTARPAPGHGWRSAPPRPGGDSPGGGSRVALAAVSLELGLASLCRVLFSSNVLSLLLRKLPGTRAPRPGRTPSPPHCRPG